MEIYAELKTKELMAEMFRQNANTTQQALALAKVAVQPKRVNNPQPKGWAAETIDSLGTATEKVTNSNGFIAWMMGLFSGHNSEDNTGGDKSYGAMDKSNHEEVAFAPSEGQ